MVASATYDPATRVVPDKLNRVTTVTDALNGQTAFTYDENSRLKSLTDRRRTGGVDEVFQHGRRRHAGTID